MLNQGDRAEFEVAREPKGRRAHPAVVLEPEEAHQTPRNALSAPLKGDEG